jgi:hypothetical protein
MPKKAATEEFGSRERRDKDLKQKMAQSVSGSAPSLVPGPRNTDVPPAPEQKETIPSIQDLIGDEDDRTTLEQLIAQRVAIDSQIKPLEKSKDLLTDRIKTQLSSYGITQMLCDGAKVSYTMTERKTINQNKLIGAGVDIETIVLCTDITKSSMLKITPAKE